MIQKTGRKICYKKLLKKNDTKNRGKKMLQKVRNKKMLQNICKCNCYKAWENITQSVSISMFAKPVANREI